MLEHVELFESYFWKINENSNLDENFFRKMFGTETPEDIEKEAKQILEDSQKISEIEEVLKKTRNPLHYKNYTKLKAQFKKGKKLLFYKFICFINQNLDDLRNNNPVYYTMQLSGELRDAGDYSYNGGPGGRTWSQ